MAYRIAIGSSDGIHVNLKFGEVSKFLIYEVEDGKTRLCETREVQQEENEAECGNKGCGTGGCGGNQSGCSGPSDVLGRVESIADCRCVVCKKVGFQAQKQFEKKAISVFDVECDIEEALEKIIFYYEKIDGHESIRRKRTEA